MRYIIGDEQHVGLGEGDMIPSLGIRAELDGSPDRQRRIPGAAGLLLDCSLEFVPSIVR